MGKLEEIVEFNQDFVDEKRFTPFTTREYEKKPVLILSFMDSRYIEFIPKTMNLKIDDAKIIQNDGGIISHPFGSVMRSIIVSIYELNVNEIFVIGRNDCRNQNKQSSCLHKLMENDHSLHKIKTLQHVGINVEKWLEEYDNPIEGLRQNISMIKNHPLLPEQVAVHGLIMDPTSGKLDLIVNGYKEGKSVVPSFS